MTGMPADQQSQPIRTALKMAHSKMLQAKLQESKAGNGGRGLAKAGRLKATARRRSLEDGAGESNMSYQ